jgi:HK97 family phage portal protein
MAWYNPFSSKTGSVSGLATEEKLNPAQPYFGEKTANSNEPTFAYERAYEEIEIVNRGVNMIVDDTSEINVVIGEDTKTAKVVKGIKKKTLDTILNKEPNPFQDISTFRRNLIIDILIDGNIFIYFDGVHLYHLPASKMVIHTSKTTYVSKYTFEERIDYSPNEIIHIKENSFYSIYRGTSRLKPALRTMLLMKKMRDFQDNFFRNGAVPGLVLKSPNTLSEKIKERMIASWQARYSPDAGGHRPLILDGGLEVDELSKIDFREMDFQASIADNEKIILKALGVPPIMLDSGNNANLRPNMRMYYLETILPISNKINKAMERFFGFEIIEDLTHIPALQPELRDQATYYTSLVNAGIITPNESRKQLGFEHLDDCDEIRIPANIAGSAANPSEGGKPVETPEE